MSEPHFTPTLAARRIAIIGVGLIGGSLAYDLRGKCSRLFAVDPDPGVAAEARRLGIFDTVTEDPSQVLPQADLLILAAPVKKIITIINALPNLHPGEAVVLDMGSTKVEITEAMASLPSRFSPVGGHPMAGKELGGLSHAQAGLFQDAAFALVKVRETASAVKPLVESLVAAVGAQAHWMTARKHDQIAAEVSHIPYLVSASLAKATPLDASVLIGTGFQSSTRLAATPPDMFIDVVRSNRDPILAALQRVSRELADIETILMEDDPEQLALWLQSAQLHHAELTGHGSRG